MRHAIALLLALVLPATPALADFHGLLNAARLSELDAVRQMLEAGDDPDPPDYHTGYSPLQFAAGNGEVEMTRLLLEAGADTEYRDHNGDRALLWAAQRGHAETVALLLEAGSPPDSPHDPHGETPLMKAAGYGGNAATVAALLTAGADPNRFENWGDTALHQAARYDQLGSLRLLLAAGANPNVVDAILLETPLHDAARGAEPEAVRLLIEAGAAVEARTKDGETPIFLAARMGLAANVEILLAHADPDGANSAGQTPLRVAMALLGGEHGDYEQTALLLAERTKDPDRGLVAALRAGFTAVAEQLLARGADVNAVGDDGVSVLAAAATLPGEALFRRLLAAGADADRFGAEALVAAAGHGNAAVVRLLLDRGIPVDAPDATGATALLLAARNAHVEMVELLLAASANPLPVDDWGHGVEDYMAVVPGRHEERIEFRSGSRASRPTDDLEAILAGIRERHATIRRLLEAAATGR